MFEVNNEDARTMPMALFWCVFVNFEHISHLVVLFLLLTLSRYMQAGWHPVISLINTAVLFPDYCAYILLNQCVFILLTE